MALGLRFLDAPLLDAVGGVVHRLGPDIRREALVLGADQPGVWVDASGLRLHLSVAAPGKRPQPAGVEGRIEDVNQLDDRTVAADAEVGADTGVVPERRITHRGHEAGGDMVDEADARREAPALGLHTGDLLGEGTNPERHPAPPLKSGAARPRSRHRRLRVRLTGGTNLPTGRQAIAAGLKPSSRRAGTQACIFRKRSLNSAGSRSPDLATASRLWRPPHPPGDPGRSPAD